jgi:hypothetical protein
MQRALLHLSHRERSARASRVEDARERAYGAPGEGLRTIEGTNPLTPTLSPIRAFTPVFDGLWGRGSALSPWQIRRIQ